MITPLNACATCGNRIVGQYWDQYRSTGDPAPHYCAWSRTGGECDPTHKCITIPPRRVAKLPPRLLGSSAAAALAFVVPSAITNAVKRGTLVPDAEMVVPSGTRPLFEERTIIAWRDRYATRKEEADDE